MEMNMIWVELSSCLVPCCYLSTCPTYQKHIVSTFSCLQCVFHSLSVYRSTLRCRSEKKFDESTLCSPAPTIKIECVESVDNSRIPGIVDSGGMNENPSSFPVPEINIRTKDLSKPNTCIGTLDIMTSDIMAVELRKAKDNPLLYKHGTLNNRSRKKSSDETRSSTGSSGTGRSKMLAIPAIFKHRSKNSLTVEDLYDDEISSACTFSVMDSEWETENSVGV